MRHIAAASMALLALALVGAQGRAPQKPTSGPGALLGKAMPAWTMKTTEGKTVSSANTKGRVVVMDFWATWCAPCKLVTPVMQELHEKHASKGLTVLGVNALELKDKNSPVHARTYKAKGKYTFSFTYGNDALMKRLKLHGVPTILVIDRKGVVRYAAGEWSDKVKADMTAVLNKVLAEKA